MYGRHFESMYSGSMIGAGAPVFAVWGYVIAHMKPPHFDVELNPKLLAFILGEPECEIESALVTLTSPDPRSRSKTEDGRRLLKKGEYLYHVVNGETYNAIRNEEEKKAYWRDQKQRQRAKSASGGYRSRVVEPKSLPAAASASGGPSQNGVTSPETGVDPKKIGETPPPTVRTGGKRGVRAPTREEVMEKAAIEGLPAQEAQKFFDHYETFAEDDHEGTKQWCIKGERVNNWTALLSKWRVNWQERVQKARGFRNSELQDLPPVVPFNVPPDQP